MINVAAIRMQQFGVRFYQASLTAEDIARALIETAEAAGRMTPADFAAARDWSARYARDEQLVPRITALTERITAER